jgi:glyoxylase I family protein
MILTMTSMPKTNTLLGGGGFHHVAIRVVDWDASIKFYTEMLGFKEKIRWGEGDGRAIMLDTGDGNYLEIFAGRKKPPVDCEESPIIHFCFRTTNIDADMERIRAAGMTVTMEAKSLDLPSTPGPTPIRIAFFKGPDGEIVELFQNELT